MYRRVEGNPRMTDNEAAKTYFDSYVLMRMDASNQTGEVLYVGDTQGELLSLLIGLERQEDCEIVEGLDIQCSLGGVLAGG